MERRHFLKLAIGVAAGAAAFAASAQAAPLSPQPLAGAERLPPANADIRRRCAGDTTCTGITGVGTTATGVGIAATGAGIAATGAGTTGIGTAVTGKARLPLTGHRIFCTSPRSPRRGKFERKGKRL